MTAASGGRRRARRSPAPDLPGVVFDTGALIAVERGDRALSVLLAESRLTGAPIAVPARCVAQAWRNPARQSRTAILLRQPHVKVVGLDDDEARRVGLLAATSTSDVVDAHVAHRLDRPVLTSDPEDIRPAVSRCGGPARVSLRRPWARPGTRPPQRTRLDCPRS
ncbi:MAG: hypothetical protein ACRDSR_22470 [Pseudonocardiaceae bacterium]